MAQQEDILSIKLEWLLNIATRLSNIFKSQSTGLLQHVESVCKDNQAIAIKDCIACEDYTYMILAKDPKQVLEKIIQRLQQENSKLYQSTLNPVMIMTKLIDQEYLLDTNGTRLCYAVRSPCPSNYVAKVIACKNILSILTYQKFIDEDSNCLVEDKIKEIHPLYDYSTKSNKIIGAKKKIKTTNKKRKQSIRTNIIAKLVEFVRQTNKLAQNIIFVGDIYEDTAVNILYTDRIHKESISAFVESLIAKEYPAYKAKVFLHAQFRVPYDFRMRKHSILINEKKTENPTYIANLYNIPSYMPLPCTKSVIRDTFINQSHPLVHLMLLYIDMYMLQIKTCSSEILSHESLYMTKLTKAYNNVLTYDKTPTWIGVYLEEAYDKIKYNMKMKISTTVDSYVI